MNQYLEGFMGKIGHFILWMSILAPCLSYGANERLRLREEIISRANHLPTIAPGRNDLARNLVDEFKYDNLLAMEAANLQAASISGSSWSGSYWPTYEGQIANRYGDRNYS